MRIILRTAFVAVALTSSGAVAAPLTLDAAIAKAVDAAPRRRADEAAVAAARGSRVQAGLRPNPTVTIESEDFAGTGGYGVFEQAQITGSYARTIERGGKRAARVALADRAVAATAASTAVTRLDIVAAVQRAYLDVLLADEAARLAADRLAIERGLEREALRRVRSAKDPLFVESRAAARVASARLEAEQATMRQRAKRRELASWWGEARDDLELAGDLIAEAKARQAAPTAENLAQADNALAEAEISRARAAVDYERSRGVQDYTVSGGVRYLRNTDDVAVVAAVTIPIGRDRNQGNIVRAKAEQQRAEFVAEAARLDRLRALFRLRQDADAALARAEGIRRDVAPRAARSLAQVREGYARGGFSFRDLQDGADAVHAAQAAYLDALSAVQAAQADIDRLTGRFGAALSTETPR